MSGTDARSPWVRTSRAQRPRLGPVRITKSRWIRIFLAIAVVVTIGGIASAIYAQHVLAGLPDPGSAPILARSIVIYDRNGAVLAEHNKQGTFHVAVKLADMGKLAPQAMLAAEDRDFYTHGALSWPAILRAIVVNTINHSSVQGGSTISQQLVKISFFNDERTLSRKIKEALIANQLERKYTKDQILELYMNRVYYGHGAYGVGAAAKTYFGNDKLVKDLSPAQAAFLAGLVNAPSAYDPRLHYDRSRDRELYVLKEMVAAGDLTQAQSTQAAAEDISKELKYDTAYRDARSPHFVDYILSRLEAQFGPALVQQGGLQVHTTLDPTMQGWAEKAVADGVHVMAGQGVNNGMMMIAKPSTGEVLAWVGSADYGNAQIGGQFDVILSRRQPGSSFKPYVYEAAYKDRKLTPASCVHDSPTSFNGYRPLDFDNSFMGVMTAQQALLLSRNVAAVEVAQKEGIANVNALATQMGIKSPLQPYLSTAIGGSEVTMFDHLQGYQVFANQGMKVPLLTITRIADASGNTLFEQAPGRQDGQQQVLSAQESYLVTNTLKDYQNQWHLGWQKQMAGKSGTSGGSEIGVHQDAWMMAYNKDIVIGGWAGNTAAGGTGSSISAFGVNTGETMLAEVINELPADDNHFFPEPSGLISKNGSLFLPGTENVVLCASSGRSDQGNGNGGNGHGNGKKHP